MRQPPQHLSQWNVSDNAGRLSRFRQCFSCCAWDFLSAYIPPPDYSEYLDDVEVCIGKTGIAEKVALKFPQVLSLGQSSLWFVVHQAAIQQRLNAAGISGSCIVVENGSFDALYHARLSGSPVIAGMSGLPYGSAALGGHMILNFLSGNKSLWNDPFGDARTAYLSQSGERLPYPDGWIKQYFTGNFLYWKET